MAVATAPSPTENPAGRALLILTCVLTALSIATTSLRLYVRHATRNLGSDDYTIATVCILAIARTCIQIVSVIRGNGKHRVLLSQEDYEFINMLGWYTQILLFITICLLKISIGLLLLRIKNDRPLKTIVYAVMAGLVLTNLAPLIILLAECDPTSQYWAPRPDGKCWDARVRIYSIYAQVGYSVLTDLICSLLPIMVLWNIKMATRKKVAVCGLMSLGLIATACAAVRAASLGVKTRDLSHDYCIASIWANTELHLGIIAANLAISRPIFFYFIPRTSTPSTSGRSRYYRSVNEGEGYNHKYFIRPRDPLPITTTTCTRGSMQDDADGIQLTGTIQKTTAFVVEKSSSSTRSVTGEYEREGSRDRVLPIQR